MRFVQGRKGDAVREEEQVLHQPQGKRERVGKQAATHQPPGAGVRLTSPREPEAEEHHTQQSRPGQQHQQPIRDGTDPGGLEQGHRQLIGQEQPNRQEGDPQHWIAPEMMVSTEGSGLCRCGRGICV